MNLSTKSQNLQNSQSTFFLLLTSYLLQYPFETKSFLVMFSQLKALFKVKVREIIAVLVKYLRQYEKECIYFFSI